MSGPPIGSIPFNRKQRLALFLLPPLAAGLLRMLGATLRFECRNDPGAQPADEFPTNPDVYVFWHRALLMAAWQYRNLGIHILISSSFDGELIARLVERLGFIPIRGSSTRGGADALLAAARARRAGSKVAITADGPRGPVYVAKPGASAIAQRSGSSASCFHLHAGSAWELRSWDRFQIPKPFSRVTIAWRAPLPSPSPEAIQQSLDSAVTAATRSA